MTQDVDRVGTFMVYGRAATGCGITPTIVRRAPSSGQRSRPPPAPHRYRPVVLGDVVTQVLTHAAGVPHGQVEKVLHTVRVGVAGVLGDAPTVLPVASQPATRTGTSVSGDGPRPPPTYVTSNSLSLATSCVRRRRPGSRNSASCCWRVGHTGGGRRGSDGETRR